MLDFNTALELMKKYGYESASLHPFIFSKDNTIGICYSYVDDNSTKRVADYIEKRCNL